MRSDKNSLFHKLAARNVRNSARDYFIYFFTLTLSVCLFYSFNSVSTQFASLGIDDPLNYLAFSSGMLTAFSVLVCVVMGALVVYANRFLLRRRKKEMGIYATLGMERRDLNRLLMRETLRIGVFSLAAGIVLGIFAAQILSLLTARLAGIAPDAYRFMISGKAIILSLVFFGILFFFVHRFNIRELRRMSLLELLSAERKNETVSVGNRFFTIPAAILSLVLIAGGYLLLDRMAAREAMKALAWGGLLLMGATVLFFTAVLQIVAGILQKNRRFYYRRLNLFTVSQFSARIKTEGASLAMTSVLLFLALSLTVLGPGIGKYAMNGVENATPYDGTVFYAPYVDWSAADETDADETSSHKSADRDNPLEHLRQSGFDLERIADRYAAFWVYEEPSVTAGFLSREKSDTVAERNLEWDMEEADIPLNIIGIEDYNEMLALQDMAPMTLGEDEFAVSYAYPPAEKTVRAFAERPQPLVIKETTLTLTEGGVWNHAWENTNVLTDRGTLVVPQRVTQQLDPQRWVVNFNVSGELKGNGMRLHELWTDASPDAYVMWTREEALVSVTSDNLLMTYLGIYLGITFLITAGAALALKQLSQAADNVKRYGLLKKLGVSPRDMRGSLRRQLGIYFCFPLVVAILHAGVVTTVLFRSLRGIDRGMTVSVAGFGSLLVLTVYAVYYITTYLGSRRILKI